MKKKVLVTSAVALALFGAVSVQNNSSADLGWRAANIRKMGGGAESIGAYVGAESGAALGSLVFPGIGTLIGGALGAY